MTISAKVALRSSSQEAADLISLVCRYPRFIHAESKTHRVINIDDDEQYLLMVEDSFMDDANLSRNASSSRAIPVEKMIADVMSDPAMPVAWGSNKPGMQAGEQMPHWQVAQEIWLEARDAAVSHAKQLVSLNAHKQIVNRILEPFGHITVIVTATEWDNFFALRCHPDADPTMQALANAMQQAISESKTTILRPGEWHLPFVTSDDHVELRGVEEHAQLETLQMISAARCARVSYLNHDGTAPDIEKDIALAKMLIKSGHMSPFEHQGTPYDPVGGQDGFQGNFQGWDQFRQWIERG